MGVLCACMLACVAAETTVHVVQTCHLDVGFCDTSAAILDRYHSYLLTAAATADDFRNNPNASIPTAGLVYTTHSYVVSLLFDCVPGMHYKCYNETEKGIVSKAIARGDIVLQAFPFNAETATLTEDLFVRSLNLTNTLTDHFGVPRSTTMTQRDVPGATRGIVPILSQHGVTAFSIGVNTASLPPALPRVFVWTDDASGSELITMLHPHGYGGVGKVDCIEAEGFDHVLCPDYKGDNEGPWSRAEIETHWSSIAAEFPGAKIIPSSYDNYVKELSKIKSSLPTFEGEMADTWIYGVPSDPLKNAQFRAMSRAMETCRDCEADVRVANFTASDQKQ